MNNMYKSKNMTIKDLKKVIENLPDDMEVFLPIYNGGDETDIFPKEHYYTNLAGIIEDNIYGKVFTFGVLTEVSNLSMYDTLEFCKGAKCIKQLFPEKHDKDDEYPTPEDIERRENEKYIKHYDDIISTLEKILPDIGRLVKRTLINELADINNNLVGICIKANRLKEITEEE